jgi:general secretion pathway protein D
MKNYKIIFNLIFCFCLTGNLLHGVEEEASPEKRKANKDDVAKQLSDLFKPIDPAKLRLLLPAQVAPYIRIIENKEDKRSTIIYRCRFAKAKGLVSSMESIISPTATVEYSEEKNLLVINDLSSKTEELKEALLALDIQVPQLLVEAQIIEVYIEAGMERDVRLKYTKTDRGDGTTSAFGTDLAETLTADQIPPPGAGFDFFPYSSGTTTSRVMKNFNVFIKWLKNTRDAKILSAPNMIVNLGATASIITGEDLPIQETQVTGDTVTTSTRYKRVGVKLNVTPELINDDLVQIQVNPEVTSVVRYETFTQNGVQDIKIPVIAIRNINTELSMVDGEIIMLGGLYSSEKLVSKRKTPFLSDIPYIGDFFNATDNSDVQKQLIFFLKMHVITPGNAEDSKFRDLDKISSDIQKAADIIEDSDIIFPLKKMRNRNDFIKMIEESPTFESLKESNKKLD